MKKSLLLSIVMTLVLVVAMSTATFAWYTANSAVSADSFKVTASTAGSNVLISTDAEDTWVDAEADYTKIDLTDLFTDAATYDPMAPIAEVTGVVSTFVKADTDNTLGKDLVKTDAATPANQKFYLKNDGSQDVTLNVTASNTGVLADHIAWVLVIDGADTANDKVITNGYGKVSVAEGVSTTGAPQGATAEMSFKVAAGDKVTVTLIVWVDGTEVLNGDQNTFAELGFTFAK